MTLNAGRAGRSPVSATFRLTDHHGNEVTDRDYLGRHLLVFFGFTNCRMVCPRALSRLSRVLGRLGPLAERIQPLYITVDPERDTPDVMKAFLTQSYPRFIGLTGSVAQIDNARAAFRVFARRVPVPGEPAGYAMPHSAFTYLFDARGEYLLHVTDAVEDDELVERLTAALR